jgi:hypothetical protein
VAWRVAYSGPRAEVTRDGHKAYLEAAGLSDRVWSPEEIVTMADSYLPKPGKRGPYKKRNQTEIL